MTVCFPPLIKPDRRFSRIRLSEFHVRISVVSCHGVGSLVESVGWCRAPASGQRSYFPMGLPCLRHSHCRSRWATK